MTGTSIALIIILVVCLVLVAGLLIAVGPLLLAMSRSKVVAQADAQPWPPFAFALRHVCQEAKLHRVCLTPLLRSQSGSTDPLRPDVGIKCAYQVTIGGAVVAREVVGFGPYPPMPFDRHITMSFSSQHTKSAAGYTSKATIILVEIESCLLGHEIIVEGSCELAPGTQAESLCVSLRA